jgi:hypothetical protein
MGEAEDAIWRGGMNDWTGSTNDSVDTYNSQNNDNTALSRQVHASHLSLGRYRRCSTVPLIAAFS